MEYNTQLYRAHTAGELIALKHDAYIEEFNKKYPKGRFTIAVCEEYKRTTYEHGIGATGEEIIPRKVHLYLCKSRGIGKSITLIGVPDIHNSGHVYINRYSPMDMNVTHYDNMKSFLFGCTRRDVPDEVKDKFLLRWSNIIIK